MELLHKVDDNVDIDDVERYSTFGGVGGHSCARGERRFSRGDAFEGIFIFLFFLTLGISVSKHVFNKDICMEQWQPLS